MTNPWNIAGDRCDLFNDKELFQQYAFTEFKSFFTEMTGWSLYPPQEIVTYRALKSDLWGEMAEIAVLFSRQTGKTLSLAALDGFESYYLPEWAEESKLYGGDIRNCLKRFDDGFDSGVFAPGMRQAKLAYTRTRNIVRKLITAKSLNMKMDSMTEFKFPNGSHREIFTAKPGSNIEGPTKHRLHIDEAQDVFDEMIRKSIYPMGAHTRATRVLTGTPTTEIEGHRYFFDFVNDPKREKDVYIFDCDEFSKYSQDYRDYVKSEIDKYGRDDIYIRCSYYLEWPLEHVSFTSLIALHRLAKDNLKRVQRKIRDSRFKEFYSNIYVGIDVAKHVDSTIVFVVELLPSDDETHPYTVRLLNIMEIKGGSYTLEKQAKLIYKFLSSYSINTVAYDYNGLGVGFFEMLTGRFKRGDLPQHSHTQHIAHHWTAFNHSDVFGRAHNEWHQERFEFPDDGSREIEEFKKQMRLLSYDFTHGSLLRCHVSEPDHDDYCSAYALCYVAIGLNYFIPERTGRQRQSTEKSFNHRTEEYKVRGFNPSARSGVRGLW